MRAVLLHYTAPPVTGGVESVMAAHAAQIANAGMPVVMLAGRGRPAAMPEGVLLCTIPEMDTQAPAVLEASRLLEQGRVPENFAALVDTLAGPLQELLTPADTVFVHNVFGKHFNLALTAALFRLMDAGVACRWVAWHHDLSWTSANSRRKVHPGWPWDLLRSLHPRMIPVAVSQQRRAELAGLVGIPEQQVRVIHNGVDPAALLGLAPAGMALIERLDLFDSELNLLMPVRVTQAKNIELAAHIVAEIKSQGLAVRLVITGPPDPHDEAIMAYYERLRALRSELDLNQEMRFVYELDDAGLPLTLPLETVGELFRVCDALLMPSHREGFGMPVLEAGLAVFASNAVPAAQELAGGEAHLFAPDDPPQAIAGRILEWAHGDAARRLRARVRRKLTWRAIFEHQIRPLLEENCPA